jgi:hypothetical protein
MSGGTEIFFSISPKIDTFPAAIGDSVVAHAIVSIPLFNEQALKNMYL